VYKFISVGLSALLAFSYFTSSHAASVSGSDILDVDYAEASINAFDTSTVNLNAGSDVANLDTYDASQANLYAGSEVSFIDAFDHSSISVYGGEISFLRLYDESHADIFNTDVSWLLVGENASATIYGSSFEYNRGHLNGLWADGTSFSFWALNMDQFGLPIHDLTNDIMPANITLSEVPLPPAAILFLSVLVPLFGVSGFRKKT